MFQFIIFDYDGWMILLYENGKQTEYWCSDANNWNSVWKIIDIAKKSYLDTEVIHIKYDDEIDDIVERYDIFNLTKNDIEELKLLSS